MFVRDVGNGPVVLCLHGTPSPAEDWMPLARVLESRNRVLVPDLPGYGQTPQLDDSSMESVGDAIAAMLHDRGVDRLHAVVGYSTGVYRAFDLVLRHVSVDHVIAIAGVVNFDDAGRQMRMQLADALDSDPAFIDSPAVHDMMRQLMLSEAWRHAHPEDEQRVIGWLKLTTSKALAAECRALARVRDLRPEIRGFAKPVYARVGELDVGATPAISQEIVSLVQHGELDVVPGCGHGLFIENLDGTVGAIANRIGSQR
jgi:pimeloyl-ACP methyl ester carboxylesterase